MGQKDLTEKNLEFYPDVFADVINALLYEGEPVIKETALQSAPTETLYHGESGGMRNQFHDVSKYLVQDDTIRLQYTLENETRGKRRMVLRKAGYTGAVYREQLDKKQIYPVIGIVLYWGRKRWRGPRSLYQLFGENPIREDTRSYMDDIRLHVYEMAHLPVEVRERFHSDMRIVVDYLASGGNYVPTKQKIKHLEALLLLLEALTGDVRYSDIVPEMLKQEREEGGITMCELIDKYENRGMRKGIRKGMQKGIRKGIRQGIQQGTENTILADIKKLMKNLKLTAEQAMVALEIPEEEKQKYLRLI